MTGTIVVSHTVADLGPPRGRVPLFSARGVKATSLDDLAARLGVPVGDLDVRIDEEAFERERRRAEAPKVAYGVVLDDEWY